MTRLVVTICFLVAFAAGLTVGYERRQVAPAPSARSNHPRGGWMTAELNLTPEQQEQFKQIWSKTWTGCRDRDERRRQAYQDRESEISSLIRAEDKPKYEEARQKCSQRTEALDAERKALWQQAVESTKSILTPEQRVKYEQFLQRHQSERGGKDRRHRDRRGNETREQPSTSPAV